MKTFCRMTLGMVVLLACRHAESQEIASSPGPCAIARWDAVPYQEVQESLALGVVAFHIQGIDRVEFILPQGRRISVRQMSRNPESQAWEYTLEIRAEDYPPGPLNIGAMAYPRVGSPRKLPDLPLWIPERRPNDPGIYVDPVHGDDRLGEGSSRRPFAHLWKAAELIARRDFPRNSDGQVIYLAPGNHLWAQSSECPQTRDRWLTLQPIPGARGAVRLVEATAAAIRSEGLELLQPRWTTQRLHLKDLEIQVALQASPGTHSALWLDGVTLIGPGAGGAEPSRFYSSSWWTGGIWVTDSRAHEVIDGFVEATLVRNAHIDGLADDAFSDSLCVINSTVRRQPGQAPYHSDLWQQRRDDLQNVILYGIRTLGECRGQGLFSRAKQIRDMAVVNCYLQEEGFPQQNQWFTPSEHLLVIQNHFLGTPWTLRLSDGPDPRIGFDAGFAASREVLFRGNVFQWLAIDGPRERWPRGVYFQHNHYLNAYFDPTRPGRPPGLTLGQNATSGPVIPAGTGAWGNLTPAESPILNRDECGGFLP